METKKNQTQTNKQINEKVTYGTGVKRAKRKDIMQ